MRFGIFILLILLQHEAVNGKTANDTKVAEVLLERGCRVNVVGGLGVTPLQYVSQLTNKCHEYLEWF